MYGSHALVGTGKQGHRVRQGERRGRVSTSETRPLTCYFSHLAVGVGFEPTVTSLPRRFSRPFP
ncbi:protein of unknown function [Streptomyces sp. KY75]|nr:protein of unknown function [Streptomyces sp. KY70]CAD5973546.1 protein of unknown function [Streptomyces sp. KY75]